MIPVIIIEGPTASGKTALAMQLAKLFKTEIISADSRQVYKYLDIGTAKPTNEELCDVKHHLISIINPDETFNAGMFCDNAMDIIKELSSKGKIPIVCGGTGLYIKALLEGLFECVITDKSTRLQLETEYNDKGLSSLYEELKSVDPESALSISYNDKQRIQRALEVYRVTGTTLSQHWRSQGRKSELKPFRILLFEERAVLYNRIDNRIVNMLDAGLLTEIENIMTMGYSWSSPGLNSVGYKEYVSYFEDNTLLHECTSKAQQHSRNYAKRQVTWYNKCTFNLTERYPAISICIVGDRIKSYFDSKMPEGLNENSR